jgi:hypothetical protein
MMQCITSISGGYQALTSLKKSYGDTRCGRQNRGRQANVG